MRQGLKFDLKGNNFKQLRGLEIEVVNKLQVSVKSKEVSIGEMAKQAKEIKKSQVQKKFIELIGVSLWEAQMLFPTFTTAEVLDKFVGCVTNNCTLYYGYNVITTFIVWSNYSFT